MDRFPSGGQSAPKKLTEAARAWVFASLGRSDPTQPVRIDAGLVAEFAAMGMTIDAPVEAEEMFAIWDNNVPVFEAFAALDTQWRMVAVPAGDSVRLMRTGLDYPALDVVLRRRGLADAAFDDVQAMEAAALDAYAEAMR